jgi:ankyrin repeat protein
MLDNTNPRALILSTETPLHLAAQYQHDPVVLNMLCTRLKRLKKVLTPRLGLPLHVAALHRKDEVVFRELLDGDCCASRLCYAVEHGRRSACDELSPFAILLQQCDTWHILQYMIHICPAVITATIARRRGVSVDCFEFMLIDPSICMETAENLVRHATDLTFAEETPGYLNALQQKLPRYILHAAVRTNHDAAVHALVAKYPELLRVRHPTKGTCLHLVAADSSISVEMRLAVIRYYADLYVDAFMLGLVCQALPERTIMSPLVLSCTSKVDPGIASDYQFLVFQEIFSRTDPAFQSSVVLCTPQDSINTSEDSSEDFLVRNGQQRSSSPLVGFRACVTERENPMAHCFSLGCPLHLACEADMPLDFIAQLVEYKPEWVYERKHGNGMLPLHSAAMMHSDPAVLNLLCNVNSSALTYFAFWWGLPCHCAVIGGRSENLKFLLSRAPYALHELDANEWITTNACQHSNMVHQFDRIIIPARDAHEEAVMPDSEAEYAFLLWVMKLPKDHQAQLTYGCARTSLVHLASVAVAQGHAEAARTFAVLLRYFPDLCGESLPWGQQSLWCRSGSFKLDQTLSAVMAKVLKAIPSARIPVHLTALLLFAIRLHQKRSTSELTARIDVLRQALQELLVTTPGIVWATCSTERLGTAGSSNLLTFARGFAQHLQLLKSDGSIEDPYCVQLWRILRNAHQSGYSSLFSGLVDRLLRAGVTPPSGVSGREFESRTRTAELILSFITPQLAEFPRPR